MQTQKRTGGARLRPNSYIEDNKRREKQHEAAAALSIIGVLSALVPPLGLFMTWCSRRITLLLRMLFTVMSLTVMTVAFIFLLGSGQSSANTDILPVPVVPDRAGYVPFKQPEATVEPYVVDFGIVDQPQTGYVITYDDGTTDLTDTTLSDDLPMDPTAGLTLVYAVTNNAVYYHLLKSCDMQTNSRTLTLEDAQAEGLIPCEKCAADLAN